MRCAPRAPKSGRTIGAIMYAGSGRSLKLGSGVGQQRPGMTFSRIGRLDLPSPGMAKTLAIGFFPLIVTGVA